MKRNTTIIRVADKKPDAAALRRAAEVLRGGGLVAFPTETVYGLGADATNDKAVRAVFKAKGRPSDNPLIVHVASVEQARGLSADFPVIAEKLAAAFWPGPLTLVLRHNGTLPRVVTTGLPTVAVRMPAHAVALALIREVGSPLVAPSANLSGRPSPTTAQHVAEDLDGRVDVILDAGATRIGLESTVLDVTESPPVLLRLGGLTRAQIEKVIGAVSRPNTAQQLQRSPGTRHRHYSPRARVVLVEQGNVGALKRLLASERGAGYRVSVIVHSASLHAVKCDDAIILPDDMEGFARGLFHALRELDARGVDVIVVESVSRDGLGAAVMDRIERAALR